MTAENTGKNSPHLFLTYCQASRIYTSQHKCGEPIPPYFISYISFLFRIQSLTERCSIAQWSSRPGFLFCFVLFLFIYLFLAALGLRCCTWAFFNCGKQGLLLVAGHRLLIAVVSLVAEHGLQARRLQQLWHAGSRAQAQQLWRTGLVAPQHVGSSRTRAQTGVPYIGRQILNHCTTREVPRPGFKTSFAF